MQSVDNSAGKTLFESCKNMISGSQQKETIMHKFIQAVFYFRQRLPFFRSRFCPGGRVLPYLGYIAMCGPKGYEFSAVLVINRACFFQSSLELGMFFRRSYFFRS